MKKSFFSVLILTSAFFLAAGCSRKDELSLARDAASRSRLYYQHASERYKKLIAKEGNPGQLRFELGQLYYDHGDFSAAQDVLKQSKIPAANKLLAMARYRLADYSGSLEIFSRNKFDDDESHYYYGMGSEKLNLYDQALEEYRKISGARFKHLALSRIENIEKKSTRLHIRDLGAQLNKSLEQAPPAQEYPQAGALILSCDESIEITSDGRQISDMRYLIKILNERGKEDFSEALIDYDSTYEKVELQYARTIRPDGSVADVGASRLRDVSKYMNFPLYSNARLFIISFPEIAVGSVIEYRVKVYGNQLINKKDFVLDYPLQVSEPVLAANFTVSVPRQRPLHIKVINDEYNDFAAVTVPQKEQKEDRLIYKWQFKNIPQIIPEAEMPTGARVNPTILLSTFGQWQEVYDWWRDLAKDRLRPNQAITDKVNELTRGKASLRDKARAIYEFCAKEVRYVAVEYGQAGYQPHFADDIFANKYGDCKDKAVLLVTMMRQAGVPACLVLIPTNDNYNLLPDFPSALFDHAIAMVRLDGSDIFVDPTAQTCAFGDLPTMDQGRRVLVFEDNGFKIIETPAFEAEHNFVKQELNIRVNPDESILARKVIRSAGFYDQAQRYWLLYTQPELIKQALKEKMQDISIGAQLKDYAIENLDDLDKPVVLRYDFSGPEYWTAAGPLRILPQLSGMDATLVAKDARRYPIDFEALDSKETIFTIAIPDNFVIKYIPADIEVSNKWIKFTLTYRQDKNKIIFRQVRVSKEREVLSPDYVVFKEFFESLAKRTKQNIILEKIK